MRKVLSLLALCLGFVVAANAAHARVNISINLSNQTMHVTSSNGGSHSWAISSARAGYVTPRGSYRPTSLQRMHYSRKYNNSPMPHSIFFRGGYAIHGTGAVSQLGRPASHGCIRLAPGNAARLFQMVKAEGASIHISGSQRPVRQGEEGEIDALRRKGVEEGPIRRSSRPGPELLRLRPATAPDDRAGARLAAGSRRIELALVNKASAVGDIQSLNTTVFWPLSRTRS